MTVVTVYATFTHPGQAQDIGMALVEERLAACVNILQPCRSIYRWEGAIETVEEVPAILKTHSWQADELVERIAVLHSYAVPCIAVWPIEKLLRRYADWVEDSVIAKR